jgi:antitoxin ParD1/3/4
MAKNTSMSLGPHFETFIRRQVSGGRFETASEVVRAGLRLLEDEESKVAAIRLALDEGEASGFAQDTSLRGVIAEVRRRAKSKNGAR